MELNIYLAGAGGHGLQVVGKTIVDAALRAGYNVTYSPRYTPEKRGGLTSCYVTVADREIGNPRKNMHDILLCTEPKAYKLFYNTVNPGGKLIVNSSLIKELHPIDEKVKLLEVPLHDICSELGNNRVISTVTLGVLSVILSDLFGEKDTLLNIMLGKLKGKESLVEINKTAFEMGRKICL